MRYTDSAGNEYTTLVPQNNANAIGISTIYVYENGINSMPAKKNNMYIYRHILSKYQKF